MGNLFSSSSEPEAPPTSNTAPPTEDATATADAAAPATSSNRKKRKQDKVTQKAPPPPAKKKTKAAAKKAPAPKTKVETTKTKAVSPARQSKLTKAMEQWATVIVGDNLLAKNMGMTIILTDDETFDQLIDQGWGDDFFQDPCLYFSPSKKKGKKQKATDDQDESIEWFSLAGPGPRGSYYSFESAARALIDDDEGYSGMALYVFTGDLGQWIDKSVGPSKFDWTDFMEAAQATKLPGLWTRPRLVAALQALRKIG